MYDFFNRNMPRLAAAKMLKLMMSGVDRIEIEGDCDYSFSMREDDILHCKGKNLDPWVVIEFTKQTPSSRNFKVVLEKTSPDYLPVKDKFLGDKDIRDAEEDLVSKGISKGVCYIDGNGNFYEFTGCSIEERLDTEHTNNYHRNPWKEPVLMDVIVYNFKTENITYNSVVDWSEGVELNVRKEFLNVEQILKLELLPIKEGSKAFIKRIQTITSEGVDSFKETIMIGESDQSEQSTELVGIASKEHMIQLREVAEEKRVLATLLNRGVRRQSSIERRKMEIEVQKMMKQVQEVQEFVNKQLAVLDKKIKQLNKLIITIELYAGISEHLVQIIEGQPSSEKTVHIRQKTIYLDEEMAVYEEQGLGWDSIEDFDKWLCASEAYKSILPEEKCVVAARVRRQNKSYDWIENPWIRSLAEAASNHTMLLFRNGDNVYRIWSDHLSYTDRLFPRKSELEENFKTVQEYYKELEESESERSREAAAENIEKQESKLFPYKKNILMLHGVFTRSEIFGEIPLGVSIMKPDTYGEYIKYVYDDELIIDSGTRKFSDWLLDINSHIVHGSRIYLANEILCKYGGNSSNDWEDRYTIYWYNDHARPALPASGVYSVKRTRGEERVKNLVEVTFSELMNTDLDDPSIASVEQHRKAQGEEDYTYLIHKKSDDGELYRTEIKESLRITFDQNHQIQKENRYEINPSNKSGKGSNYVSFKIVPEHDNFIINLDRVTIEDLDYFINDKSQRENYLSTMPILIGIRKALMKELDNEREFADAMAHRINGELNLYDIDLVRSEVHKSIDWYKNKLATVIKRPLHVDGKEAKKAWGLVELNTKRSLKKLKKLKIDVSGIESGTFVYEGRHRFRLIQDSYWSPFKVGKIVAVINANSKSEAVDKVYEAIKNGGVFREIGKDNKDITKSMLKREMRIDNERVGTSEPIVTFYES